MQPILEHLILFFTLLSLTIHPHFIMLANANSIKLPDSIRWANETDYEALLAIKAGIDSDDPDSVLSSWNNSLHFCHWGGVTCGSRHNRVVRLDLSVSNLVGTLSPFVGNLSFLHVLSLLNNSFRGAIPSQISHLSRLRVLSLERNSFEGEIPANLSRCSHLRVLDLSYNKLVGRIPSELAALPSLRAFSLLVNDLSGRIQDIGIGNMSTSLQILLLDQNHLWGSIPDDFGRFEGLTELALGDTLLSGTIPTSIFNLSSLQILYLSNTKIKGNLPLDFGLRFPQLHYLAITNTSLSGQFPTSLSNLSKIQVLAMSLNSFTGMFSIDGNYLPHLSWLNIDQAFSLGGEAMDLSFVDTLTNCTHLQGLLISGSWFTGTFPRSILNLSTTLEVIDMQSNPVSGPIPFGLGKFVNLLLMLLDGTQFTGPIPFDFCKLESIGRIQLADNNLSGELPYCLGNLSRLSVLSLSNNNLEGPIPTSLGKCQSLETIDLTHNKFSGVLPAELFRASNLISIVIRQNNFQGSFPDEVSMLKNLVGLDVSENRFSGEIPSALGGCTSLTILNMSGNSFTGSIPNSLGPLKSIQTLDLSSNDLSGQLPNYFSSWPYLSSLNLSFNNLDGEVPSNGVFANTSIVSVVGNNKLCGGVFDLHLRTCPSHGESKRRRLSLGLIVIISVACLVVVLSVVVICFCLLCSKRKTKDTSFESPDIKPILEVSYQMLLKATNGFSSSNLIGSGGFGSVYKGILHQDDTELVVAVKVMKLQNKGAGKSFLAECNALRNIRHRNLVKIITACSSIDTQCNDFKALIYEFMPRGNLEEWLYPNRVTDEHVHDDQSGSLSLFQRLNIVIDVASALEYLHTECANPIIHCDLKPSNILLDDDMIARIGDFGLAKFISGESTSSTTNQTSSTQVRGTVGYAAPEYGLGSKVSPEADIYSFGIIVLEMMTSKKPTDPMFNDGLNLHGYSNSSLPHQVMELIDHTMLGDTNVLHPRTSGDIKIIECINSLVMVGVQCSMELPQERMSISNALIQLKSARRNILSS